MYERLVETALRSGAEIVGCASVVDYEDGRQVENYAAIPEGLRDKNHCIIDILAQKRYAWGAVHNKIFKRNLFDFVAFPKVRHLEDYVVTTKFFNEANAIYFCPTPYYHHICNMASLSHSNWYPGRLTIPETAEQIAEYLRRENTHNEVRKATYRFVFLFYVDTFWLIYKAKPRDAADIRKKLRRKGVNALWGYLLHSHKELRDIKLIIKFVLGIL